MLKEDISYFDYPLPRKELLGFIRYLMKGLKRREKHLRTKKSDLYAWYDSVKGSIHPV